MENSKINSVVVDHGKTVSVAELKEMFPEKKNTITQQTVDVINSAIVDPNFDCHTFLGELTTFGSVMKNRSMSMRDYIRAVKFVAYMPIADYNVTVAYKMSFPEDQFVMDRANAKTDTSAYRELSNQASRYSRTKGVVDIQTMAQTPFDLMFQGERYRMLGVLSTEATEAAYSKDRTAAADKFLVHTAKMVNAMQIDVSVDTDKVVGVQQQLLEQLRLVGEAQAKQHADGVPLDELQKLNLKDVITVEAE